MKKNIFGIIAVVIALSASAFTLPHKAVKKTTDSLLWFDISGSVTANTATPTANATYRGSMDDGPDAPDNDCPSGSIHQCIAGFESSQVDLTTFQLKSTSQLRVKEVDKN